MTHPDELLAEYVDGALDAPDRAADLASLQLHLAGCEQCRADVALARHARQALGRLSDHPAPTGVAAAAVRESTRRTDRVTAAARPPQWYRFAPAAAAAAVILLLVIAIPRLTADKSEAPAAAGLARASPTERTAPVFATSTSPAADGVTPAVQPFSGPAKGLETLNQDFDTTSLRTLTSAPASFGSYASPAEFETAKKCVTSAEHRQAGLLVRLIRASYLGTSSYFAVFTPEKKGVPTGQVNVIVVTTDGCSLLVFTGSAAP